MSRTTIFVTIANLKGGVGKTTTTINLAAALALQGKKVLVVDLDFQGNATTGLGIPRNPEKSALAIVNGRYQIGECILPTETENLSVIGAHKDLIEFVRSRNSSIGREFLLEEWRDSPELAQFDLVFFDTRPDMDCFTMSALVASDFYIVPLFAELDPIVGLTDMFEQIEVIRKRYNKMLSHLGIVITKYDKTESTHKKLEQKLREGEKNGNYQVFKTVIPTSKRLSAAKLAAVPVVVSDPGSPVTVAFLSLAGEIIPRLKPRLTGRSVKGVEFASVEREIIAESESSEVL